MLRAVASSAAASSSALGSIVPQGRLTLTTVAPVLTATVSGATTIFYTPYLGAAVPIYNGSAFIATSFSELSNATAQSSTGSAGPAVVANNSVYDLFVWSNAGVLTLTRGPLWTSATVRSAGTALVRQNGILLNSIAITNGPGASLGTYVGTVASNGTATIDYIFGAAASGGTASSLQVWNAYNRVMTATTVTDNGASYTYTTATTRQARGSAGNQVSFVVGLSEDAAQATYVSEIATAVAVAAFGTVGIGLDSTTTYASQRGIVNSEAVASFNGSASVGASLYPGIGTHILSANERGDGTNANTFDNISTNNLIVVIQN